MKSILSLRNQKLLKPFSVNRLSQFHSFTKNSFPNTVYNSATNSNSSTLTQSSVDTQLDVETKINTFSKYIINTYSRPDIIISKGEGCFLSDSSGGKYLDFTSGIAVLALGHSDPGVAKVISEQAKKITHISNLFYSEESGDLAKLLVENTIQAYPQGNVGLYASENGKPSPRVFFTNSGTEANEGALKFARKYGKIIAKEGKLRLSKADMLVSDPNLKSNIHCFTGGFHGRSMGALSVTPNPKYQNPYTPLIPGVTCSLYNNINELNTFVDERTCGVIVEPIQGEGGVNIGNIEFLKALRKRCTEVGAVLIYDEIQCGLARTGKIWAHHHYPPECSPDIITCAKPLGNGFPIGAIIASEQVSQKISVGDHGTTFGGNPLGCAIGKHVFSRISQPEFLDSVTDKGVYLKETLQKLAEPYLGNQIVEVRGKGMIYGIQFANAPSNIVELARNNGLLLVEAGKNTIRIIPPLVITKKEIDLGIDILKDVLKTVFQK
ncbi:hypothetical protein BB559_001030 [Furculomyces boomerangus]|uniref:acetylornithine transaminase n=1 Tax=Furculomyces boomerangus TaxID=61424 RepID=A0A2T9Z3B1_9FUNG|nr:hypothetical protein BB559_003976 [Furculomyces boomerangus]PVU99077.1 hypothetical protein BB559_001030 [Furculomyces boomerangus]